MGWWGKLIGGTFGMLLGGPIGAVLGGALGHQFDKGVARLGSITVSSGGEEALQAAFFTATFTVMGRLAKADGQVSREEIGLAETIMAEMQLDPAMRKVAIRLFRQGKQPDFPLDEVLEQFRRLAGRRRNLLRLFIEIQLQAAYADGALDPAEARLLEHLADRLGFPLRIPLKMTADSGERDRLAHRFLTGVGFLLRAVTIGQLGGKLAHRLAAQVEAVRTVQQPVEDGVRQGRLADVLVPVLSG